MLNSDQKRINPILWFEVFCKDYIDSYKIKWTGKEEVIIISTNKSHPLMLLMVMSKHMSSDTS